MRWVRLDGLHLTLRFLGPTLDPARRAARELPSWPAGRRPAQQPDPSGSSLGPPARSPKVGDHGPSGSTSDEGVAELTALAASVDEALVAAGWSPETRPYKAHLTLARSDGVPAGRAIAQTLMAEAADLRIPATIDRIGLFESLTGGGPGPIRSRWRSSRSPDRRPSRGSWLRGRSAGR